jgi:hypothetical protein
MVSAYINIKMPEKEHQVKEEENNPRQDGYGKKNIGADPYGFGRMISGAPDKNIIYRQE